MSKQPEAMEVGSFLPVQVGANLVRLASTNGMTLCTTRLEEGSALAGVTCARELNASLKQRDWN